MSRGAKRGEVWVRALSRGERETRMHAAACYLCVALKEQDAPPRDEVEALDESARTHKDAAGHHML